MAGDSAQKRFASGVTAFTDVPPTGKGGTSDDQVNRLKDFVALMQEGNLGFLYKRWVRHPCADPGQKGKWQGQSIWNADDRSKLDGLRGIDISSLDEMKMRLNQTSFATGSLGDLGSSLGKSVDGAWNSRNSAKALGKFTDLQKASKTASDAVNGLRGNVDGLVDSVNAVTKKLGDFWDSACKKGSGIIDQQGWLGNDGADAGDERGGRSSFIDDIDAALKYGCYRNGSSGNWHPAGAPSPARPGMENQMVAGPDMAQKIRSPGFLDLGESNVFSSTFWSNDICNQMDKMCAEYYAAIIGFRGLMTDAHSSLDKAFSTFNSQLKSVDTDPFGKLVAPGDAPPAPAQPHQNTPPPARHSPPRTDDPAKTAPAHAAPGGGQQAPANVQPPPAAPTGQHELTPAMPSVANPAGPRQDGVPPPASHGHQETVKVKGANGGTIEMSSPDGQGHLKLSVDDGSGKPKSYDVDFGQGMGVPGHDAATPAADAPPGRHALDQTAGPPGDTASPQPADQQHGSGLPGGDGATAQRVQADHSGHAVIHDGDNTITIDKGAGESGEVKVTVDDGSGKPTSYTMGTGSPNQQGPPATAGQTAAGPPASHVAAAGGMPQQGLAGADSGGQQQGHSPAAFSPQQGNPAGGDFDSGASSGPAAGAASGMDSAGGPPPVDHTAFTTTANVQAGVASAAADPAAGAGGDSGAGVGAGVAGPAQPLSPGAISGADPATGAAGHHDTGQPAAGGQPGIADAGGAHAAGAAAGPGVAGPAGGAEPGGGEGGMPMMGGMGGGGGGGDSERGASAWRTQGDLFSDIGESAIDRVEDLLDGHDRR